MLPIILPVQAILQIICCQNSIVLQCKCGKRAYLCNDKNKIRVRYLKIPSLTVLDRMQAGRVTGGRKDRHKDRPKPICSLKFIEVGGIIM